MANTNNKSTSSNADVQSQEGNADELRKIFCGIVMPIADNPDYSLGHWLEVKEIIEEAFVNDVDIELFLVSDDPSVGLIHERIVTNLYENDIVICDVSSKNPNVMFELGMRLAFDKPVVIIKDERTNYSFDIGGIEHLTYPSVLDYHSIVKFKKLLREKVLATIEKSKKDTNYSPFLKSFSRAISAGKIIESKLSEGEAIIEEVKNLRRDVLNLRNSIRNEDQDKILINEPGARLINNPINMQRMIGYAKEYTSIYSGVNEEKLISALSEYNSKRDLKINDAAIKAIAKEYLKDI